jgi:uncharacterized protein (TIGR04255 family)
LSAPGLRLADPPIVEAVLDLDCDMPPGQDIASLEAPAREAFGERYPKLRTQLLHAHRIEQQIGGPAQLSSRQRIQALQLLQEDGRQLVQVRVRGFSFNRLAPYTRLDDYLPEIERTWRLFVRLASPVQVRLIRLRYINRLLLPLVADWVELSDFLTIGPRLPGEESLRLAGFLNQYVAIENDTENEVTITLTMQPLDNNRLPVIFDIAALQAVAAEPGDWESLLAHIQSLRNLKNRVFRNALTERSLDLFR